MGKKAPGKVKTDNKQEELKHAIESAPGDKWNQSHNAKKEALGPNTNR